MHKPRILIVDDDAILRSGIRYYLEDSGFEVVEATNGLEGIRQVRETTPDLVLCDLRMPEMDGLKVLETLADVRDELPFIVVTGQGVLQDAIAAMQHGAWDFITKPIKDMRILDYAIDRCLERAALIRENRLYRDHLEEQVKQRTYEFEESEARLRSILESFHHAFVVVFNRHGAIRDLEGPPELYDRYGISSETSRDLQFDTIFDKKDFIRHQEAMRKVFADGLPQIAEYTAHLPAGSFWFEITHSALRDSSGQIVAVVCFFQDVTQRHDTEMEKAHLEVQLRQAQKLEAIGTLAGGIAHDFNNILSAILGFTHLAMQDTKSQPQVYATLQEVYTAGQRAAALVKQILTFSRRTEQNAAPMLVAPVVKEALKLLRASLPASIEIDAHIPDESLSISADPTQVHQIVLNMGTNAYHAMKGRNAGHLTVSLKSCDPAEIEGETRPSLITGKHVCLQFEDTGRGMPPEVLEKIFEPFFTTKPVGEGTGMGLAIVHGIVTQAGGQIQVDSKIEEGTTFELYFPAVQAESTMDQTDDMLLPTGTGSVLYVDDEEQLVLLGEVILERLGYRVMGCSNPLQALELFRLNPEGYDYVVTDQTMPQMTGISLIHELRTIRPDIAVVLMTGQGRERLEQELVDTVSVLDKPMNAGTLAAILKTATSKAPQTTE